MNRGKHMMVLVAFLALSAASPRLARASDGGMLAPEGIERVERIPLPHAARVTALHVHALDALVLLETSQPVALARALRLAPPGFCPDLDVTGSGVLLRCRSRRIVARLADDRRGTVLEVAETRGLPWGGEDGAPLVALDPRELGLGAACPGSTPAGRAECLLDRGDRRGARAAFAALEGTSADGLPALRLGDLDFADGDVLGATSHWTRARGEPWERLAAARLCELSWACVASADVASLYRADDLPASVARDLQLRRVRALAFLGRSLQGARELLDRSAEGACAAAPALCRDVAAGALAAPGPEALDALALWLTFPAHEPGVGAYEASLAAAAVAEREGAPIFAANLLAATAGQVPARMLRDHLLHTAELFLAGGDRVRAEVVLAFARARAGAHGLPGPRWKQVAQAVREPNAPVNGERRRTTTTNAIPRSHDSTRARPTAAPTGGLAP